MMLATTRISTTIYMTELLEDRILHDSYVTHDVFLRLTVRNGDTGTVAPRTVLVLRLDLTYVIEIFGQMIS